MPQSRSVEALRTGRGRGIARQLPGSLLSAREAPVEMVVLILSLRKVVRTYTTCRRARLSTALELDVDLSRTLHTVGQSEISSNKQKRPYHSLEMERVNYSSEMLAGLQAYNCTELTNDGILRVEVHR